MIALTVLFSLCTLIAGDQLPQAALPTSLYAPPTPVITPQPAYGPPVQYAAPAPVSAVPVPVAVYQSPVAVPLPGPAPAPPPVPITTYGIPGAKNVEGQELQGGSLPGPENAPGVPNALGSQIAPGALNAPGLLNLPTNTQVEIRDNSGQYSHGFNQEGTQITEQGKLITTNGGWEYVIAKKGSYSYVSPEGKRITVHYIADHNGYRVLDNPDSESL